MTIAGTPSPPPLPGLAPLFDAAAMRDADRRATADHAIPSILLMERAGLAAAQEILARQWPERAALVLVGAGNNGGDGMVVARHLAEAGWAVSVRAPGGAAPATPDGATMAAIAAGIGIGVEAFDPAAPHGRALVVDALLGTGARGAPRGDIGAAVEWIAGHEGPVVALDVPTGVEADTGRVEGAAVRADLTVTFHGDMVGLHVEPGRAHAGGVAVVDIGIPSAVRIAPAAWLADRGAIAAVPAKGAASDKYASGSVLVVAGSPGLTGAACLAARATLRAGAGLTVVATPAGAAAAVSAQLLEVMCAPAARPGRPPGPRVGRPRAGRGGPRLGARARAGPRPRGGHHRSRGGPHRPRGAAAGARRRRPVAPEGRARAAGRPRPPHGHHPPHRRGGPSAGARADGGGGRPPRRRRRSWRSAPARPSC